MTVNIHDEVVSTRYDETKRMTSYTLQRNGKHWTVDIPLNEFERIGMHAQAKGARQNLLRNRLEAALRGFSDEEKEAQNAEKA